MRKPQRLGTDSGHKMDFLVREERQSLAGEPRGLPAGSTTETGAEPSEAPYRLKTRFGYASHATGVRRHGTKRAARKGLRRAGRMLDHALAGGFEVRDWHP